MYIFSSCKDAIKACLDNQNFTVAHLYKTEKTMDMHIHDCYEIYYSISGGKQFLINNKLYNFKSGDIFFINQFESHRLSQIEEALHERIVLSIFPGYIKKLSTDKTNLDYCFSKRDEKCSNKLSLSSEDKKRFQYFIHELSSSKGYGQEILDHAIFLEMMVFLNRLFYEKYNGKVEASENLNKQHDKIIEIFSYINQHLSEDLSIKNLADQFYISPSYLSALFKKQTGTTINKYITAQRINLAKSFLSDGHSVTETCSLCGYVDYSNFLKAFTSAVGISPKKYAQFSSR